MAKQQWTTENIPDQTGKVVIVTGSSSGIGYEAARVLAMKNATVILAVRNRNKGDKAIQDIMAQYSQAKVQRMDLDLADLKSIKQFVTDFKKDYKQLDLLINNAGVMIPPYSLTQDGFELQMGTNHLGHFALTALLYPLLQKSKDARIVNVSSMAHKFGDIDFKDLHWEKRKYKAGRAYGDSKIANLYFTYELARRSRGKGPMVTAAHPGWTATDLQRHIKGGSLANRVFGQPIRMGALPTLRAATDPDALSGDFYGPDGFMEMKGYPVKVISNQLSQDTERAQLLWQVSEELTGVEFNIES